MVSITQSTISLSILVLAASFALSCGQEVNPFCKSADDKVLCSQLAHGAKTWKEAMVNVLNGELAKAKNGKGIILTIATKLPKDVKPVTKKSIEGTCNREYHENMDNLKQCIGYILKSDPENSFMVKLSAVSFSDCTDALGEFRVMVPEVTQYAKEILKLTGIALAVAGQKP